MFDKIFFTNCMIDALNLDKNDKYVYLSINIDSYSNITVDVVYWIDNEYVYDEIIYLKNYELSKTIVDLLKFFGIVGYNPKLQKLQIELTADSLPEIKTESIFFNVC